MKLLSNVIAVICCINVITISAIVADYPCDMVVAVEVANLVAEPGLDHEVKRGPVLSRNVPRLDTQLMRDERVRASGELLVNEIIWVKVDALQQKKVILDVDGNYQLIPYSGWMRKKDLAELVAIPALNLAPDAKKIEHKSRQEGIGENLVGYARSFLGSPYVWGGCSEYKADADYLTGVDCSSLIHLSYRKCGIEIPRDAHDQYLATNPVQPSQMKPGDLIFFGVERERNGKIEIRMNHVLMYIGKETLIEAFAGNPAYSDVDDLSVQEKALARIREISIEERLGRSLSELDNGAFLPNRKHFIYFRTVFR